jgi:hypothetical protein
MKKNDKQTCTLLLIMAQAIKKAYQNTELRIKIIYYLGYNKSHPTEDDFFTLLKF